MNKKILTFTLLFCSTINILLSEDKSFSIKINQDYYNPFACSFEWLFSYNKNLSQNQYINLHFYIYNRQNNQLLESFDKKFMPEKNKGRFYLFISVKPPNTEFYFNSPDSIDSSCVTSFGDVILNNQRLISRKIIETNISEKTILVRMEPIPLINFNTPEYYIKDICTHYIKKPEGREKIFNYDIYIIPELKFQENITRAISFSPANNNSKYIGLSQKELLNKLNEQLRKRREMEEKYRQNKVSVDELNKIQSEINIMEHILKP